MRTQGLHHAAVAVQPRRVLPHASSCALPPTARCPDRPGIGAIHRRAPGMKPGARSRLRRLGFASDSDAVTVRQAGRVARSRTLLANRRRSAASGVRTARAASSDPAVCPRGDRDQSNDRLRSRRRASHAAPTSSIHRSTSESGSSRAENTTSRPADDRSTSPAPSRTARCFAIACRDTGSSDASRDADAGPCEVRRS